MLFVERNGQDENIYEANQVAKDSFSTPVNLEEVNSVHSEGAMCLSQNGRIMLFAAEGRRSSYGGYDIYISIKKDSFWTVPKNLGSAINSRYWDSTPSLSSDLKTLYFSSKRPGGQGGSDIWRSQFTSSGEWGKPENLSDVINTEGNDEAPFIHPDGQSLYFVSDTHIGMGSYDIFRSNLDENGNWSVPENLGYPINTKEREGGLFIELLGNRAYYSSQQSTDTFHVSRPGDIYYFNLPEKAKPKPVSYLRVIVVDSETKQTLPAEVQIIELSEKTKKVKGTDGKGKLLVVIQPGNYVVNVSKEGYLFHSENISLDSMTLGKEPFEYEVELIAQKKYETPIVLNNIFFETGSAELKELSNVEIQILGDLLSSNENLKIKILGHTDNVGSEAANLTLSENRAKAVFEKLISLGIAAERLSYEGRGETDPIDTNETEEGRTKNRRTEFIEVK